MKKQKKDLATLNSSFLSLDALFLPPSDRPKTLIFCCLSLF